MLPILAILFLIKYQIKKNFCKEAADLKVFKSRKRLFHWIKFGKKVLPWHQSGYRTGQLECGQFLAFLKRVFIKRKKNKEESLLRSLVDRYELWDCSFERERGNSVALRAPKTGASWGNKNENRPKMKTLVFLMERRERGPSQGSRLKMKVSRIRLY